jgi:tRNA pseudouridine13 synthase
LKDKHGATRQLFSSAAPLKADTGDDRLAIRFVGKSVTPLTAEIIQGNRFRIVMRNLGERDLAVLPSNAEEVRRYGMPNYYDNQRFGGIAHGQGFIAKALIQGNYEEAVRLHLAAPHRKQNMKDKTNRRLAIEHWGDWETLHGVMRKSPERALVEFLREHPGEWGACFERITPSLRTMFVAAYQSYLFNRTLSRFVAAEVADAEVLRNRSGELAFHRALDDARMAAWRELKAPLLGPNTPLESFPAMAEHAQAVLEEEGIALEQLRLDGLSRTRFKSAERAALLFPDKFEMSDPAPDELNVGRHKVEVKCELPRGCFATMVSRRLVMWARE